VKLVRHNNFTGPRLSEEAQSERDDEIGRKFAERRAKEERSSQRKGMTHSPQIKSGYYANAASLMQTLVPDQVESTS
jgi:hypothetical protein